MTPIPISYNQDEPVSLSDAMYNGMRRYMNGTLKTRYEILKKINAPEETYNDLKDTIGFLILLGIITGISISAIVVGVTYLAFQVI
jgi:hypothetical protein